MADSLSDWAAGRAPDLLARAEQEAVAVLRDALVSAALGGRGPQRRPARTQPEGDDGEVLWAYGVVAAGTSLPAKLVGVAGSQVEPVAAGELIALVGTVPRAEFGATALRDNLNDLGWLERVAREHEAVLDQVLAGATLVPLRLCTIFEDAEGVRRMLVREHDALGGALARLEGRQEWGVKLLLDFDRLTAHAVPAAQEALHGEGGAAYLERRRSEREAREAARGLAAEIVGEVHTRLLACATDAVRLPAQNRELSGYEGEMLLNAAYLVEAERVEQLRAAVDELRRRHDEVGTRLELTGPWPPYNFVTGDAAQEPA